MALIAAAGLPDRKLRKNIRLLAEQQGVSPEAFAPKSEKEKKAIRLPLSSQQPRCGEGSNNFGLCTRFQVHPSNGVSHQFSGQLEIVLPRCCGMPMVKTIQQGHMWDVFQNIGRNTTSPASSCR